MKNKTDWAESEKSARWQRQLSDTCRWMKQQASNVYYIITANELHSCVLAI